MTYHTKKYGWNIKGEVNDMLNYIATSETSALIQKICKKLKIMILYENNDITNISKYVKETKINFNLIKYFIIEINCLDNKDDEIIEDIYNFSRVFNRIRFIILAQGIEEQSYLLNQFFEKGIYNIINVNTEQEIEEQLIKCLSNEGMQEKDAKRFEKKQETEVKEKKVNKFKDKLKEYKNKRNSQKIKKEKPKLKNRDIEVHQMRGVYFFALILEAITRLVKLICYMLVFILTSIGLTILLNNDLREIVFQIFGLK